MEKQSKPIFVQPNIPKIDRLIVPPTGTKQILDTQGADGLVQWILAQDDVLLTDTTFRDAHQSLLATRVRSHDMYQIADATARMMHQLFSLEMWGGATFDVAYRFLKEDPWSV